MNKRFEGKAVIVTGGGNGIGSAAALAFAAEGAGVVVADVSEKDAARTADAARSAGGRALAVACDAARGDDVRRMVAEAVREFGGVDVLFNSAGIVRCGSVVDMCEDDWDRVMNVNLRSVFLTCKHAIPEMRKRRGGGGGGAIVNTASAQAFASQQTVAAYAASKGGVVSLTHAIAVDHAREGIRCNCIAPGSVRTPLLEAAAKEFASRDPEAAIREWGEMHPLGRVGTPEEVARLVLFLASEDASFCTGGCYAVDGGLLSSLM